MPTKKTVEKWGFKHLGYECDGDEVKKMWCNLCREYSEMTDISNAKKGVAKLASEVFIKGTNVIKKNNYSDHMKKSKVHNDAMTRLSEKRKAESSKKPSEDTTKEVEEASLSCSSAPRQATLTPYIQRINANQRSQLTRKMQLAHFTAINAKSFSFYEKMGKFCKDTLKVRNFKLSFSLYLPIKNLSKRFFHLYHLKFLFVKVY